MSFFDFSFNNIFPPVRGAQLLNETLAIAATITDDDLRFGAEVQIDWPSVGSRLNNCTVRFRNEAENFKEDSVSWPPKVSTTSDIGIGGRTYPVSTGWGTDANGVFLSAFGVWLTAGNTISFNWLIKPKISGNHTLKSFLSGTGTLAVDGVTQTQGTTTIYLAANVVYSLSIYCTDTDYPRGVAATLVDTAGREWWSTREPAYTDIVVKTVTNDIYNAMMVEDSGVVLESDVFLEGVTDYYHALARAEETVRTSRSALVVSFEFIFKNMFLEPGDYIRFNSGRLQLGTATPLYLKVDEVKMKDTLVCSVKATRFDWTQLAWNVKDDEYLRPAKQYSFEVAAPAALYFTDGSSSSTGTLSWPLVNDSSVVDYVLYVNTVGSNDTHGVPLFQEVGRSAQSPFILPLLSGSQFNFGVKSHTANNRYSAMTTTDCNAPTEIVGKTPPQAVNLVATSSTTKAKVSLTWDVPQQRVDASTYDDHLTTTIWRSPSNTFASAGKIGEAVSTSFDDLDEVYSAMYYWVRLTSSKGRSGPESTSATATFSHHGGVTTDTTPPAAPYDLIVTSGYSILFLEWTLPSYTTGGGHAYCKVYAAKKIGVSAPSFASAKLYERCYSNNTVFTGGSAETWYFWISNVSKGGGESPTCTPAFGTTAVDVGAMLTALNGQITSSALHTSLGTRIDLVDAPTTGLVTKTNTAISNAGTALSTANTAVATANGASSAVSTLATLTAGPSGNTATYTVKVDANGYVAGYGLSSSSNGEGGVSSSFLMRVDRFAVGSPGATAKYPFIIDGGVTYMDVALIKDATITSAKIGSLNADVINAGTITGRKFRTASSGNRIEMADTGVGADNIVGYNASGSETFRLTAIGAGYDTTLYIPSAAGSGSLGVVSGKPCIVSANGSSVDLCRNGVGAQVSSGLSYYYAIMGLASAGGVGVTGRTVSGVAGVEGAAASSGTNYSAGVLGATSAASQFGVKGSTYHSSSYGVYGYSGGAGAAAVVGNADTGHGVYGIAQSGSGGPAVVGLAWGNYCAGVQGLAVGSSSKGVTGSGTAFDFYAEGAGSNYGPFTGSHDILLEATDEAAQGDIVCDNSPVVHSSISSALMLGARSTSATDKRCVGVLASRRALTKLTAPTSLLTPLSIANPEDTTRAVRVGLELYFEGAHHTAIINSVGEGLINVCGENGSIEAGDLIVTSNTAGKGMKQADGLVRNYTVAKAREAAAFAYAGEVKQIACIYLCG